MDQKKPSDAFTKQPRRVRTAAIGVTSLLAVAGLGWGTVALAQTFNQRPAPSVVVASEPTDEPNLEPIASFSVLTVDGLTVTVDGGNSIDPDGEVVSYVWDFGDGQTGTGASASHTYGTYGTYTITLTVIDTEDSEGAFPVGVTLNAPPPPPAPPVDPGPAYGNYPPGYPMPRVPGTDQPDTAACASGAGMTNGDGEQVCA